VGEGETDKKTKETQNTEGHSVSEKSQVTRTSKNLFEKSNSRWTRETTTMRTGGNSEDEDGEYEDGTGDGGDGTVSRSYTPNGHRLTVFTSQQEQ